MKIVVIGGTGNIGSKLVPQLAQHGHETVAAAPTTGVNTLTGEGLTDALASASVVIDVSNSPSFEDNAVMRFFETSARNLLAAEAAAGVAHHVALSVVGTERLPESGYFQAKVAQEQLIETAPSATTPGQIRLSVPACGSIAECRCSAPAPRRPPLEVRDAVRAVRHV